MGRLSLTYMHTSFARTLATFAGQLGGGGRGTGARAAGEGKLHSLSKRALLFVLRALYHVRRVYYELGVCSAACAPLFAMLEEHLNALIPLVLGERYLAMSQLVDDARAGGGGGGGDGGGGGSGGEGVSAAASPGGGVDMDKAIEVVKAFQMHWKMDCGTAAVFLTSAFVCQEVGVCVVIWCGVVCGVVWCVVCGQRIDACGCRIQKKGECF